MSAVKFDCALHCPLDGPRLTGRAADDRMMKFRQIAKGAMPGLCVAASALVLASCAFQGPRTPRINLPSGFEQAGQVPLASLELDRWWVNFNDPQLNTLIEEAMQRAPDALTASQRILEAQATRRSSVAQTLPRGNIAGNASRRTTEDLGGGGSPLFPTGGTTENETLNFNVTWEIDLFGRVSAARRVAANDFAAVRFNAEGSRAALVANVADAYFQARGLAIQRRDAIETVRIQRELRHIAQVRSDRGLAAISDVQRIDGDLAQALSQVENLTAELHAQQRTLLVLVGRGFDPTESLPVDATIADAPPVPDAIPGEILTRRPDVRESAARLSGAIGRQRLQNLALYPTFNILPGLGLSRSVSPGVAIGPNGGFVPATNTSSSGFWSFGLGVTIPVLDIPRLLEDIRAQDARTEQAVIAYERTVQTAYGEADNALVRLASDERRLAILKAGELSARAASSAARRRYQLGLDDLQTTLSAEQAWRNTRAALTSQQVQTVRRAVQVYKALGGGWVSGSAAATGERSR